MQLARFADIPLGNRGWLCGDGFHLGEFYDQLLNLALEESISAVRSLRVRTSGGSIVTLVSHPVPVSYRGRPLRLAVHSGTGQMNRRPAQRRVLPDLEGREASRQQRRQSSSASTFQSSINFTSTEPLRVARSASAGGRARSKVKIGGFWVVGGGREHFAVRIYHPVKRLGVRRQRPAKLHPPHPRPGADFRPGPPPARAKRARRREAQGCEAMCW